MFDHNELEEQCPKCKGKGQIENTTWYHNWAIRNSKHHILETKEIFDMIKEAPDHQLKHFSFVRIVMAEGKYLKRKRNNLWSL